MTVIGHKPNFRIIVRQVFDSLEQMVFMLPVIVVLLVSVTFLFQEGKCAAWQWWSAVLITMIVCTFRAKNRLLSCLIFALLLGIVWLLSNMLIVPGSSDMLRCYFPSTRLIYEGWNPVWDVNAERITKLAGVDFSSLSIGHIVSSPKVVEYFSAAALYFTGSHFNIFFPLILFLVISLTYSISDLFEDKTSFLRRSIGIFTALSIVIGAMPTLLAPIDVVVAISAVGLLCAMYSYVHSGVWNGRRLVVWTFWMASAKASGLLQCCAFWTIFFLFNLMRTQRLLSKYVVVCCISFLLFGVSTFSPYITKHLSPHFLAFDTNKPLNSAFCCVRKRLTSDFFDRNQDAASMGHLGAWCNAFISSSLVSKYYCLKLGKEDFVPDVSPWGQNTSRSPGSPTSVLFKVLFCIFLGLLFFHGSSGCFIAMCMIVGTMAIPTEMIGYTRYVPWALSSGVFVVPMLYGFFQNKKWMGWVLACITAVVSLCKPMIHLAYYIDNAYAVEKTLRTASPKIVIPCDSGNGVISAIGNIYSANVRLLLKQAKNLTGVRMLQINEKPIDEVNRNWLPFPCNGFAAGPDCCLLEHSGYLRLCKNGKQKMYLPFFVCKTLLVTPFRLFGLWVS